MKKNIGFLAVLSLLALAALACQFASQILGGERAAMTGEPSPVPQRAGTQVPGSPAPTTAPATAPASPAAPATEIPTPGTPAAGPAGQLAFWSNRYGRWEIFLMNADGSGQSRLSTYGSYDYWPPAWSPDGTSIAFRFDTEEGNEVRLMVVPKETGTGPLAESTLADITTLVSPAWSPDGRQVAFFSDENGDIYIVNADGSGLANLTQSKESDWHPAWSPDGQKILFQSSREGSWALYLMDPDGGSPARLASELDQDSCYPAWSPEGSKIAFHNCSGSSGEIYVMNADGSGVTNLTDDPADDSYPVWSPDGTRIAFSSDRDGDDEIYVAGLDGLPPVQLTHNSVLDWGPAWSPDGSSLAFASSTGDGQSAICVVAAGGGELYCLTDDPSMNTYPAWRPP